MMRTLGLGGGVVGGIGLSWRVGEDVEDARLRLEWECMEPNLSLKGIKLSIIPRDYIKPFHRRTTTVVPGCCTTIVTHPTLFNTYCCKKDYKNIY